MYRTFNCGVGLLLAVDKEDANNIVKFLDDIGEKVWVIGHLVDKGEQDSVVIN